VTENGTSIRRMGSRRATLDGVELLKLKGDKVIDSGVAERLIRFGAHGLIRKGGELWVEVAQLITAGLDLMFVCAGVSMMMEVEGTTRIIARGRRRGS
jgi:hypothetical protein